MARYEIQGAETVERDVIMILENGKLEEVDTSDSEAQEQDE